jgi:NAD-dependent deacetylase
MISGKTISVLSGAGISAESGIQTFRGAGGLWEGHDVMEVASIHGWNKNPELVLNFYNQRRSHLKDVLPNLGHKALVELEEKYLVHIITQNVDDLHERAGSSKVIHLHGELRKVRSLGKSSLVYDWEDDLIIGDKCEEGHQLRPHIVWFGEEVPLLPTAAYLISESEIIIIVGTSMQVYPAASLVGYAPQNTSIYYVDPKPSINYELSSIKNLKIYPENATSGLRKLVDELMRD